MTVPLIGSRQLYVYNIVLPFTFHSFSTHFLFTSTRWFIFRFEKIKHISTSLDQFHLDWKFIRTRPVTIIGHCEAVYPLICLTWPNLTLRFSSFPWSLTHVLERFISIVLIPSPGSVSIVPLFLDCYHDNPSGEQQKAFFAKCVIYLMESGGERLVHRMWQNLSNRISKSWIRWTPGIYLKELYYLSVKQSL